MLTADYSLRVVKTSYSAGYESRSHSHRDAQVIYPSRGVMLIETAMGYWIVPPMRACWLPANMEHIVRTSSFMEMHSIYCRGRSLLMKLPCHGAMFPVPALLRELILWVGSQRETDRISCQLKRAKAVLADQLQFQSQHAQPPLHLPSLAETKLACIENTLKANASDRTTLQSWASKLGMSSKTLARRFNKITGMTFTAYRIQFRLFRAIEMLASGATSTTVAYHLGFASPSAFTTQFKAATGSTPGRYFKNSK